MQSAVHITSTATQPLLICCSCFIRPGTWRPLAPALLRLLRLLLLLLRLLLIVLQRCSCRCVSWRVLGMMKSLCICCLGALALSAESSLLLQVMAC